MATENMSFIIIVDDQATNRRIWAQLASELDSSACVESFSNPPDALSRIKARTPDLIITDFQMPEMNGAEFIREIRKLPAAEDVPVIVVSVYEDRILRYEALEAGATDFLMSPVDHYEFRTRAKNLLTLRSQQLQLKERADSLEDELKTEAARHEEAMRNSYEQLLAVIDTVPALVYAANAKGEFVLINRSAAEFLDIEGGDCIGTPVKDIFHAQKANNEAKRDEKLLTGELDSIAFEEQLFNRDGNERTFLTTKSCLIDPETGRRNVLTVSLDINSRKNMELELAASTDAAQSANRAKTEFLANMSHELRTPLNAVIGFSEVMASEYLGPIANPKYVEYAADIHGSATHLLGIISDILDLARIEEGSAELSEDEINIDAVFIELQKMLRTESQSRDVRIEITRQQSGPYLRGDAQKIRQALLNVIANALKFSDDGGAVLVASRINSENRICLSIEDQGIGMTPDQINIALARFGQVFDQPHSKKYQGSGLGLPIAAGFVELHGGEFVVESEPGRGTIIQVSFPASRTIEQSQVTENSGVRLAGSL